MPSNVLRWSNESEKDASIYHVPMPRKYFCNSNIKRASGSDSFIQFVARPRLSHTLPRLLSFYLYVIFVRLAYIRSSHTRAMPQHSNGKWHKICYAIKICFAPNKRSSLFASLYYYYCFFLPLPVRIIYNTFTRICLMPRVCVWNEHPHTHTHTRANAERAKHHCSHFRRNEEKRIWNKFHIKPISWILSLAHSCAHRSRRRRRRAHSWSSDFRFRPNKLSFVESCLESHDESNGGKMHINWPRESSQ